MSLFVFARSVVNTQKINRLFGCVFLVWRHHLRKVNKSSVRTFRRFFSAIFLSLMFLNNRIDWIILKTYDQQFTLTTKKSLHIIFKIVVSCLKFNSQWTVKWQCSSQPSFQELSETLWDQTRAVASRSCQWMHVQVHGVTSPPNASRHIHTVSQNTSHLWPAITLNGLWHFFGQKCYR